MAWIKIDDHFVDHPKLAKAGPLAGWLHVCALCYCGRYLTDGLVPYEMVPRLADLSGIGVDDYTVPGAAMGHDVTAAELAAHLVAIGLWEDCEDGYQIHDYLEYNPSRATVLAEREAARERMSRGRTARTAERPAHDAESSPEVRHVFARSAPEVQQSPSPSPSPSPSESEEEEEAPQAVATVVADPERADIMRLVETLFGLKAMHGEETEALIGEYGTRRVLSALQTSFQHNAKSWAYVRAVLEGRGKARASPAGNGHSPPNGPASVEVFQDWARELEEAKHGGKD